MRIAIVILLLAATTVHASDFESRYYTSVFSGDLSWVPDAAPGTPSGLAIMTRFEKVFLLGTEDASITELEDPLVAAIARRFQDYWREALLSPAKLEDAERHLMTDLARLVALDSPGADPDDLDNELTELLARRGFGYRGGRTRPLLDFMLWRNTRTRDYDVELTDMQQPVVVYFLEDFVVRGWAHFATFARSGTGGWADRDALYCIADAYDLESERFTNSYLRHEARHFADYSRYPKLEGADLEYRAKLTELAFSTDAAGLLRRFQQHADDASAAPHPLANWHVLQDMAANANSACQDTALQCLESVTNEALQAAARRALASHTDKLNVLGADTVTATLTPTANK